MENINFRGIPTSLFLNGPKLGISSDPQDQLEKVGVATFTGIATASFPDANFALDGGSISFKWYYDGSQILDTTEDLNSNASIEFFDDAVGSGSTITINGLGLDDTNKKVYFEVDYAPSAYQTTPPVTAGTARSTGNAFNEPLASSEANLTILPIIEITSQPEDVTIGQTFEASYSIAARTTPGDGPVNYQWQLNGNDLSDGTTTTTVNGSATGQITFVPIDPATGLAQAGGATIDFSELSSYDFGEKGFGTSDLRLTANADVTVKLYLVGAGGGTSKTRSVQGGAGGSAEGTFTFLKDQDYMLRIGGNGAGVSLRRRTGGGDGGGGSGDHGGGGGYTGLFIGSSTPDYTQANAIIMAGGGGGGANDPATGGVGGGAEGGDGGNAPGRGGRGGTQSGGGAGGGNGTSGSALQGGPGGGDINDGQFAGGGGGGGYFGGGGGQTNNGCCADGAGGGGSGFIHPTLITDGVLTQGEGTVPEGVNGSFRIEIQSSTKTVTTTISGATTENLSITTDDQASGVIRCKVTADGVQESPVFSRSVSYYIVGIRNLVKIEQYDYTNATATLSENDLSDGSLSLSYDSHPGNAICLYAGEQDIDVEIDMYGGKGSDNGSNLGGEGGYSKIRFTMEKDVEYILTGLFSAVNAPFLYRKATLIAVVGEGGDAGTTSGNGGFGGGINLGGQGAGGARGGTGAGVFAAGTLPSAGLFGTLTSLEAVPPDQNHEDAFGTANPTTGGRTIPCTRGVYWREQGKAPCEDLGTIKFRTSDGTEISNTAEITRGYKAGYNIIQTKGAQESGAGQGGSGATGGQGGTNANGGGGGGSGYTDGSVTVVKTTQGGSTGPARINIKLSTGNYFIDDQGRILIYASTDARDPETGITKTTEMVNYGDNACIDDARWQTFLDLARDGTQDYRLTATENNSTVKITNATEKNIYKMMNANQHPLSTSLTDWYNKSYAYDLRMLAWDETSGSSVSGSDYSMLSWSPAGSYGYGFYGSSSNSFFTPTTYGWKTGINFWILPPGVPDF